MNGKIRIPGDERFDLSSLPVESATVIAKGDLISYESGYAVKLDAATEDATFAGIAESHSFAGETAPVVIHRKCIVDIAVDEAAYTYGQDLMLNAGGTALADATANTIAWSLEDTASGNVTTLKVLIDVVALGKLFAVAA